MIDPNQSYELGQFPADPVWTATRPSQSEAGPRTCHARTGTRFPAKNRALATEARQDGGRELRSCIQTLRALLDHSSEITLLTDFSGKITYCNAASQTLLSLAPLLLEGNALLDFIHPDDQAEVRHVYKTLGQHARAVVGWSARMLRRDGTWRTIAGEARNLHRSLSVEAITLHGRDATGEVKTEENLSESNERFKKAFRSSPLPITISTVAEGRYLDVNDAFLQMLHCERSQVIGRTAKELDFWVHPEKRTQLQQQLHASGVVKGLQVTMKTSSGEIREASVSAEQVELDGQTCMLAISQDVTETRRLEELVRQSQKMDAIGRLAGGVAHDFNNALSVIMGFSELSLGHLELDHPAVKNLQQIKKAARQASDLTRQLLTFSRQQILFPQVLDLNSVITHMNDMLTHVIGEDLSLSVQGQRALGCIKADFGQLQQIIMNLALNARDAMPNGGQLIIETANVTLGEGFVGQAAPAIPPGNYIVLSVSDTGCGMDRETASKIFEPFFTTKAPGKGTGLGLPTVYGIVRQSNGHIFVYSEPGAGTTFKLYFPRVEGSAASLPSAPVEQVSPGGSETLLVVEDNQALRALTVELLEKAGYRVLHAANGEMAIRLAQEHQGVIDLVLTDVIMTGMNGFELARRIGNRNPGTRVLFMSGYARDLIARFGAIEPGVALLEKPFTRQSLLTAVSAILRS